MANEKGATKKIAAGNQDEPRGTLRRSEGGTARFAEGRRAEIMEWIREEGSARVRELSKAFGVSEVTIRQDLERLEADGHIERVHGGAFLKSVQQQVRSMALQHHENMDAKSRIGAAAAALVEDGETITLDSGSTTTQVAAHLLERRDLTVITNGLNIALMLGAQPSITVHMPGGQFKAPTLSVSGEGSAEFFAGLFVRRLFLAAAAVSIEEGMSIPSLGDIPIKRAMIASAEKVYLLVDSTKIGRRSFSSVGPVTMIHAVITDSGISDADKARFEHMGIEVIIA
ncbi:DeoR/GlpR family DNA-binding transcription regulator [Novosphingobium sediminicola]|uniref:DeoR/GlpR family transcriptional regulator of sugar metabolism n=1 Tax=Novosphingobium sediminicola TaxID=563162 RepID=A0A7W6CEC8_9SPHN|nr:DeoR/GlpR family DNA-binding transcription regulator [Novosphingobium sediminicola]MBB3953925.1 DeoR/GlpR family transcriptional regulator of sugar metabolism [Novosphingobium sediminicola]